MSDTGRDECEHGSLRRKCERCSDAAEIADLRADCVTWAQRAKDAEDALSRVTIERSKEGADLRAEVEREKADAKHARDGFYACQREMDEARASLARAEARLHDFESSTIADVVQDLAAQKENVAGIAASLARVTEERDEAHSERESIVGKLYGELERTREQRRLALAECARLREEGVAQERRRAMCAHCGSCRACPPPATGPRECVVCHSLLDKGPHAAWCSDPTPATGPAPEWTPLPLPAKRILPEEAPRSPAEDAAPRCEACGGGGYEAVTGRPCEWCEPWVAKGGTGRSATKEK